MKSIISALLTFVFLAACAVQPPSFDPRLAATETGATTAYKRTLLTGGTTAALDGISGANLNENDFAFVLLGGSLYVYQYKDYGSAQSESSPDIIVPDTSPGNYAWQLQEIPGGASVITSNTTLYIATTGNDTTGDGTSGTPWYSLEKVFDYLKNKWINTDVIVTVSVGSGTYTGLSEVVINHPCANRIEIIAPSTTPTLTFNANGITVDGVSLRLIENIDIYGPSSDIGLYVKNNGSVNTYDFGVSHFANCVYLYSDSSLIHSTSSMVIDNCSYGIQVEKGSYAVTPGAALTTVTYGFYSGDSSEIKAYSGTVTTASAVGFYATRDSFIDASSTSCTSCATSYDPAITSAESGTPTFDNWGSWIQK